MEDGLELANNNICIICGYNGMHEPTLVGKNKIAGSYEYCPSCDFHYGYHNLNGDGSYPSEWTDWDIVQDYRQKWIINGMRWSNPDQTFYKKPADWNPKKQLENIDIFLDDHNQIIKSN